ncbi:glutamine amidotransferase [Desulfohalotomaculum tongense]|uniref:imidazole glycerol phosphate synthase subunit HisH n=1 Tax=Desulforadius tongensis TaxID=1216062 RepID=UPI0019587F9F|nr:imidazole glycerol phosphate synthase subunit HisH [Desulforadius tongensis]MBM7854266.1 glutamine amidotransferase [Desulforadius tongensis]
MIAIIDYGMGNLRSVQKGFEKVGYRAEIVNAPEKLVNYSGVVLPGVGAFADAMENLHQTGLVKAIKEIAASGKPLLGICLGQQLLFEYSEEWGKTPGLGIFAGRVRRLPPGLKVPHMGWNQIEIKRQSPLLEGVPDGSAFYFVHSYHVDPADGDVILTTTHYGVRFASIVGENNVFGIQFHPEKSSRLGLQILQNFGKLVERCW